MIQTIGRAARNLNGRAILYADSITKSMAKAMDETERRRTRQMAFNQEHGITPKGIKKSVEDIMEGARAPGGGRKNQRKVAQSSAESQIDVSAMEPKQVADKIKELEQRMFECVKNLEFEEAARIRDEVQRIKDQAFIQ